jgi:hypothetical protein
MILNVCSTNFIAGVTVLSGAIATGCFHQVGHVHHRPHRCVSRESLELYLDMRVRDRVGHIDFWVLPSLSQLWMINSRFWNAYIRSRTEVVLLGLWAASLPNGSPYCRPLASYFRTSYILTQLFAYGPAGEAVH